MARIRNFSRTSWMVIAVFAGLMLAPSAAVATATGVTELAGTGGQRAAVTNAGQLTTTEAAPGQYQVRLSDASASGPGPVCVSFPVLSRTSGFVITEINVNVQAVTDPGLSNVALIEGKGCNLRKGIDQVNPATVGTTVIPLDPGVAIPKGGTISFQLQDGIGAEIFVFGYTVPAKDVPGYTPNGQ